jgi:hypothetical protein
MLPLDRLDLLLVHPHSSPSKSCQEKSYKKYFV